jgi:hypothetical protein
MALDPRPPNSLATAISSGAYTVTSAGAVPIPDRGSDIDQVEPDDEDGAAPVFQIKLMRDWRRSSTAIDQLPEDVRKGKAGLPSIVAQSSELPTGNANDKSAPLSGTVS